MAGRLPARTIMLSGHLTALSTRSEPLCKLPCFSDPHPAAAQAGKEGRLQTVLTLLARPVRLVRSQQQPGASQGLPAEPDPALFESGPESSLWEALQAVKPAMRPDMAVGSFLEACTPLAQPVADYFDNVRLGSLAAMRPCVPFPAAGLLGECSNT